MEYLKMDGKTVDEAIEKVCRIMDVSKDDLEIEIVHDGTPQGENRRFGFQRARIKASLKNTVSSIQPVPPKKSTYPTYPTYPTKVSSAKTSSPEKLKEAKEALSTVLEKANFSIRSITTKQSAEDITLNIESDESSLLIGRQGETLEALQHIVSKIVNNSEERKTRILIDIGDYRYRKNQSLIALAKKTSRKVKACGRPISITPMNAYDRRIIHITLEKDKYVRTESFGEGALKKVVVFPLDSSSRPRDRRFEGR